MAGDFARWAATETAATLKHDTPACPVCRDTGIVQCAEQDGSGVYEQACPEPVHATAETDAAVAAMMQGRKRADELFALSDDENWLGI